ncbi:uncharacterized protein LOC129264470 [Lytechinus pictus]|uniref:uncharacterized protein LOC121418416 n=1 Tax=Lytechinus variegatus TaxID=7654 RepID=UPI001BB1C303|nr:uncharacterized protein LOC121418416 [Lytechinus variegatus]XP_054758329.1 uncharacterized protein LOC129264470 [Lytechinus pictus]
MIMELPKSFRLDNGDLVQQIGLLAWLHKGDDAKSLYKTITGVRVGHELWHRLSGQDEIEAYRAETIGAIVDYVKKHPKASKDELAKEVAKQLQIFASKIDAM